MLQWSKHIQTPTVGASLNSYQYSSTGIPTRIPNIAIVSCHVPQMCLIMVLVIIEAFRGGTQEEVADAPIIAGKAQHPAGHHECLLILHAASRVPLQVLPEKNLAWKNNNSSCKFESHLVPDTFA